MRWQGIGTGRWEGREEHQGVYGPGTTRRVEEEEADKEFEEEEKEAEESCDEKCDVKPCRMGGKE